MITSNTCTVHLSPAAQSPKGKRGSDYTVADSDESAAGRPRASGDSALQAMERGRRAAVSRAARGRARVQSAHQRRGWGGVKGASPAGPPVFEKFVNISRQLFSKRKICGKIEKNGSARDKNMKQGVLAQSRRSGADSQGRGVTRAA